MPATLQAGDAVYKEHEGLPTFCSSLTTFVQRKEDNMPLPGHSSSHLQIFFWMFSSSYNSFNTCWECLLHNLLLHQASELCCVKNYLLKPDLNQVPQVSSTASWLSYSGSRWRAWRKWPKISVSPPTAEPQLKLPPLTEATWNGPCRGTRAL